MSHSFFNLSPYHDAPEPNHDAHRDYCASLTEAEHEALMTRAIALGEMLLDTIDTASETADHPLAYEVILEALRFVTWCMKRDMAEEHCDA